MVDGRRASENSLDQDPVHDAAQAKVTTFQPSYSFYDIKSKT